MATLQFKNNATTTLSGSINNSQTSVTVTSSANFPALAGGDYFYATMYETSGAVEINIEIVKVTATSGNNWTIVRAQDGTSARSRDGVSVCAIEQRMTAASAQLMAQRDSNLSDLPNAATARTNLGLGSMATQDASAVAITGGTISGVAVTGIDASTTFQDDVDSTKKFQFQVAGITTGTTRSLTVPNQDGTIALVSNLTSGYQPLDSDLTALAALAANGLVARTATGTMAVRSITAPAAGLTLTNPDGVSGNPTIALANDLAAVEGISTTGFVRRTASETWSASAIVDADIPSALTGKTYNAITPTANATGFSVAGGTTSKTLTVTNSMTLSGTDGTVITLPATTGTVALSNQTQFIGTTSVALNRTSGALALTGVSIDGAAGSAATATTATRATNLAGGNSTTLLGSVGYQSAADTTTLLSPNVSTTKQFLSQTGTGVNGAAPVWSVVAKADVGLSLVENTAVSTWAGSANLTTLGTVAAGTWNATTISIAKGGTGQTTALAAFDALSPATTLGDTLYHDGTDNVRLAGNITATRRFMRQTGTGAASAAPVWDTLLDADLPAALTGKSYNALALTAASVGFTLAGGTTSKTLTVSNTLTLAGTDASTLNIGAGGTLGSAAYTASTAYAPAAGSTSIVTLGTVTAGTWTGSVIGISYGGTGAATKAAGFNALSPVTTLGDLIYGDGANSNARLAGNTVAAKRFLTQTGNGTISAVPGWNALIDGDIPSALTGKTYNGVNLTANATGFSVAGGATSKTLAVSNNLTLAGTDGSTLNIGAGGTLGSAAFTASSAYPSTTGAGASGTWGININGTVGATTPAAGSFTSLNVSATTTSTGGDAALIYESRNTSASNAQQFVVKHDLGGVILGNVRSSTQVIASNTVVGTFSSTGLSVTGGISATGTPDPTYGHVALFSGTGAKSGVSIGDAGSSGGYVTLGSSGNNMTFSLGAAERMRLDASGNLGLGVTPSAWGSGKAFEIGSGGNGIWSGSGYTSLLQNTAFTSGAYRYVTSQTAARFDIETNVFKWLTAPSGTAGQPISFTQAMTLDASGNLNIANLTASKAVFTDASKNLTTTGTLGVAQGGTGATTAAAALTALGALPTTGGTLSGNLTFGGTGRRILGDFSNGTHASRTLFQTSSTSTTNVGIIPGSAATAAYLFVYGLPDPDNAHYLSLMSHGTGNYLYSAKTGTGTDQPLIVFAGGANRMTFATSGSITAHSGLQETRTALGANDINLVLGNYFTKTISGATTLTVSNAPASGTAASFILDLTNGGSAAITWWAGVKWAGGTAPTLTAAGRDCLGFFTHDGGTTWTGLVLGKDLK